MNLVHFNNKYMFIFQEEFVFEDMKTCLYMVVIINFLYFPTMCAILQTGKFSCKILKVPFEFWRWLFEGDLCMFLVLLMFLYNIFRFYKIFSWYQTYTMLVMMWYWIFCYPFDKKCRFLKITYFCSLQ